MAPKKPQKTAETQMVRVPTDLLRALGEAGRAAGRSVPKELEYRLRESLERTGGAHMASPWARAVSEAVARLAGEIEGVVSDAETRLGMMTWGVSRLFSDLGRRADTTLSKEDRELVELLAAALAAKLKRETNSVLLEEIPLE